MHKLSIVVDANFHPKILRQVSDFWNVSIVIRILVTYSKISKFKPTKRLSIRNNVIDGSYTLYCATFIMFNHPVSHIFTNIVTFVTVR